jgi:toxin ParE1/3/4
MVPVVVEILEQAIEEMTGARVWYEQRSAAVALRFLRELDVAVSQIASNPQRWPEHLHGTRRYLMNRFPYLIVFETLPDRVRIIACQHGAQKPGYWRRRV